MVWCAYRSQPDRRNAWPVDFPAIRGAQRPVLHVNIGPLNPCAGAVLNRPKPPRCDARAGCTAMTKLETGWSLTPKTPVSPHALPPSPMFSFCCLQDRRRSNIALHGAWFHRPCHQPSEPSEPPSTATNHRLGILPRAHNLRLTRHRRTGWRRWRQWWRRIPK